MSDKIDSEKDSLLKQINNDTLFRRHPSNESKWNHTMFLLNEMRRDKYIRGSVTEDEAELSITIRGIEFRDNGGYSGSRKSESRKKWKGRVMDVVCGIVIGVVISLITLLISGKAQ